MRFTDSLFYDLDAEWEKVTALATEFHVPITFPIAGHPEHYVKRPRLQFGENQQIRCQDISGQFTLYRYNLLKRLAASPTGEVQVIELCESDEALQLASLWKDKIPCEGSLRNFASRINRDFAKYGMPWAVSYSHNLCRFILRFLPDLQTERKKYHLHLPSKLFFQNSVSPGNTAFSAFHSSAKPVLQITQPCSHVTLE